jgi:eukaryotic-like serine/threonine-protein kinase
VIVGSRSYDLLALDEASGRRAWTRYIWFSWVESPAAVRDGTVYVGSSDAAKLFAFDGDTGDRRWEIDAGGWAWGQPAVTATRVFIGTGGTPHYLADHRGGALAVDRATGRPVWRHPVAPSDTGDFGFAGSPAVGGGLVYFGGLDGHVYAFRQ